MLRPIGQEAEDVAKVCPWLDVAEAAAREERRKERVHGAAVIAADKEPVFSSYRFTAEGELAHVVVNGQASVLEELRESDSLVACVANAIRYRRVVEDLVGLRVAPREERIDNRS